MFIVILLILSVILNITLIYGSYNSVKKIEYYEDRILEFFNRSSSILATCRELDRRQMFEKDDEVGVVFQQLIDVIGELRKLIYDPETEEKE